LYPISLNISDQLCLVIGGGKVAERKVLSLLEARARVRLISPQLTARLRELAEAGQIDWLARCFQPGDLVDGPFFLLVFAATDSRQVNESVAREAATAGKLVNVADAPERSSFHVPAMVRQGDLSIAVSTNGKSPALAARIRKQLGADYGQEYAVLLDLLGRIRERTLAGEHDGLAHDGLARKNLFENLLHEDILRWIKTGQWEQLRSHLRAVLGPDADFDLSQPDNR
jgi:precorrin-2 dehydrogenase/sirohydrochlorin ferrochelatase